MRTTTAEVATAGLGRESARALSATGAHVILAGRNDDALRAAQSEIEEQRPHARVSIVALDLTSLASVRTAAATLCEICGSLDVLMNNAGVMFTPLRRTTDGFELQLGTNHLGHFELTRLLLPLLRAGAGARVVILSSDGHRMSDIDYADPNWERRPYNKFEAYGASKTANILHAVELDRRLRGDGVRAVAVHPGVVATSLARYMKRDDFETLRARAGSNPSGSQVLNDVLTPEEGAATQVWAATSADLAGIGSAYLADCAIRDDAESYACDPQRAAQWWEMSERLCSA